MVHTVKAPESTSASLLRAAMSLWQAAAYHQYLKCLTLDCLHCMQLPLDQEVRPSLQGLLTMQPLALHTVAHFVVLWIVKGLKFDAAAEAGALPLCRPLRGTLLKRIWWLLAPVL